MITISKTIKSINSNAEYSVLSDDINQITWLNGTTPISVEDIEAKKIELQADYDAKQYQRNRAAEYPSIVDQLDDIYNNGIDAWKATIKTTKDKYPK
jgi:hypothetical protein